MILLNKYGKYNGNLNPDNILLDDNYHPRLTNFCSYEKRTNKSYYDAPEVLENNEFNFKSDVYSFGIIMYEIITLLKPFSEIENLDTETKILQIKQGYRPQFTLHVNEKIKELIESCWSQDPEERPTFEELFCKLAYDKIYLEGIIVEDVMNYVDSIKYDLIFCTICNKIIKKNDLSYYSCYPYHTNCIECSICHKKINAEEYVCVSPNLFFCQKHLNEIDNQDIFPKEKLIEYQDKAIDGIIDEVFDSKSFNDDQILDYCQEDIFIDSELIQNSYQVDKPYKWFVPTLKIHFNISSQIIDFNKLQKLLGKDMIIIKAKKGSLFLKIAFFASDESKEFLQNHEKICSLIKGKLESSIIGKPVDFNIIKSEYKDPDIKTIKRFYKRSSCNLLQNFQSLNKIKIDEIKAKVSEKLHQEKSTKVWEFFIKYQELFEKIEKQVDRDIHNNKIEMILIGQTIIANKYIEEYEEIKKEIPEKDISELVLYHGSSLLNHHKIVVEHFKEPEFDDENKHDMGFYGKGIYATDNIFYSTYYADNKKLNLCKHLEPNEKASIICCLTIHNKQYSVEIKKKQLGCEIDSDTINNYGIHHVYVGNNYHQYGEPISKEQCEKEIVGSEEFVFGNKFQIIPLCSFKVKRAEYLILWKDEHIDNKENSAYLRYFRKNIEANIYAVKTVEEAIEIVKLKKANKIKLITNSGENLSGKLLIEETRKIMKSSFICLVFAREIKNIEWVSKMENVLFTKESIDFKDFIYLDMMNEQILKYVHNLESKYKTKFNINEKSLFRFPNFFDTKRFS